MVSTSVFQDRAGVEESNRQAADWVRQNMAPLLPNPPQITAGKLSRTQRSRRSLFARIDP
jgi:hypothetical protein